MTVFEGLSVLFSLGAILTAYFRSNKVAEDGIKRWVEGKLVDHVTQEVFNMYCDFTRREFHSMKEDVERRHKETHLKLDNITRMLMGWARRTMKIDNEDE